MQPLETHLPRLDVAPWLEWLSDSTRRLLPAMVGVGCQTNGRESSLTVEIAVFMALAPYAQETQEYTDSHKHSRIFLSCIRPLQGTVTCANSNRKWLMKIQCQVGFGQCHWSTVTRWIISLVVEAHHLKKKINKRLHTQSHSVQCVCVYVCVFV